MAIEELIASPVPEIALLVGGLLAIIIAILGSSKKTRLDEVAIVLAFFVGIFMIALAILEIAYGDVPISTVIVLGILGFSLFSRGFKKIKWAFIISILIAGGIGLLLNHLATTFSLEFLSLTVILIIAFVIFIVLFLILKAIETTVRFTGAVVSFRPIMFVGGLLAVLEAVLLFMGTSISGLLG
jgi:hypothetical protein